MGWILQNLPHILYIAALMAAFVFIIFWLLLYHPYLQVPFQYRWTRMHYGEFYLVYTDYQQFSHALLVQPGYYVNDPRRSWYDPDKQPWAVLKAPTSQFRTLYDDPEQKHWEAHNIFYFGPGKLWGPFSFHEFKARFENGETLEQLFHAILEQRKREHQQLVVAEDPTKPKPPPEKSKRLTHEERYKRRHDWFNQALMGSVVVSMVFWVGGPDYAIKILILGVAASFAGAYYYQKSDYCQRGIDAKERDEDAKWAAEDAAWTKYEIDLKAWEEKKQFTDAVTPTRSGMSDLGRSIVESLRRGS